MRKITVTIPVTVQLNVDDDQNVSDVVADLNFTVEKTDLDSYDIADFGWTPGNAVTEDSR